MAEKLKFIKNIRKQTVFLALATAMFLLVGGFVVYSIVFLGKNVNDSLNAPVPSAPPAKFDINGFENLKLIR